MSIMVPRHHFFDPIVRQSQSFSHLADLFWVEVLANKADLSELVGKGRGIANVLC